MTHGAHKKWGKTEILVDETVLLGYNESIVYTNKAVKRRVGMQAAVQRAPVGGKGYGSVC